MYLSRPPEPVQWICALPREPNRGKMLREAPGRAEKLAGAAVHLGIRRSQ